MTNTNQQRRHFTRIDFNTEYHLSTTDGHQQWSGQVVDLSLHGILIKQPDGFTGKQGDDLKLKLILGSSDVSVQMDVKIAHMHDELIGFECLNIDIDSMTHLRRILELNLGDPALVEREITEMIDIHSN